MKLYTRRSKHHLPISLEAAWDFFSNPKNLSVLTPENMGFKTLSGDDRQIYAGQIIHYMITPLFGIEMQWVTEITHMVTGKYFVDEQRYGPYAFWHHKHFFNQIPGGVEIEDIIHYKLPLGILGQLGHPILVKPQLDNLFDYRRNKLTELFGIIK